MISRLRGTLIEQGDANLLMDVGGVCYEVMVAPSILAAIIERLGPSQELELRTFHYQQLEVGRGIPVLIGFLHDIEREFFLRFISVSGVGPKAAIKALTLPIPAIAQAIDEGNLAVLRSLPGIGEQRAKEIVAKLQGKVGKYALMRTKEASAQPQPKDQKASEIEEEAIAILVQLEYKKPEAREMVEMVLKRNPKIASAEELLNQVYRQQRATEPAHA